MKDKNLWIKIIGGIFVGFLNGFFGGGGGMIVVPLLTLFLHMPEQKAHASAILVILPLSIASSIIYITKGAMQFDVLGIVSSGVLVGGIIGAILLKKTNNTALRVIFSVIMIIAGIKMVI